MWQIHQVRNRDITSNDRAPRQVCSCEDDRPHRNTHRHRHFTHEHRPRVVGTTTLGHDACTRSSAVVLATEAPARCAPQDCQPAAASPCTLCRYRHTCPWMTLQPLLPPQKPLTSPDLLPRTSSKHLALPPPPPTTHPPMFLASSKRKRELSKTHLAVSTIPPPTDRAPPPASDEPANTPPPPAYLFSIVSMSTFSLHSLNEYSAYTPNETTPRTPLTQTLIS